MKLEAAVPEHMKNANPEQQIGKSRGGVPAERRHSRMPGQKVRRSAETPLRHPSPLTSEVLILPDGQILAHDLTPAFTDLLHRLNPEDPHFTPRQAASARLKQDSSRSKVEPSRTIEFKDQP